MTAGAPLPLLANVPATTTLYIEIPSDFDLGDLVAAAIDLAETLSHLTITRTDGGMTTDPTIDFQLLVAAGDDRGGACTGGTRALRAQITGNTDFSSTTVSIDESVILQGALDVINTGAFTLCASTTSSVDANLSLTGIGVSLGVAGNCEAPQDLAGLWTGTFTCDDDCQGSTSSTPPAAVEIRITQAGDTAIYQDDSGATYIGNVCGTAFQHLGLGAGYFEYGTFTRTGPTSATKTSTWVDTSIPQCGGTCSDTLVLSSN